MIYLKLSKNQDQEWSLMTISSLAKMLVGVNNVFDDMKSVTENTFECSAKRPIHAA